MKSAVSPHKLLFFFQNLSPSLCICRHGCDAIEYEIESKNDLDSSKLCPSQ